MTTDEQAREAAEKCFDTYYDSINFSAELDFSKDIKHAYLAGFQAATALSASSEKRIRGAAGELLDEIDSCLELGGPSYDCADPLRAALEPEE